MNKQNQTEILNQMFKDMMHKNCPNQAFKAAVCKF